MLAKLSSGFCRHRALLNYEGVDGNLILGAVSDTVAASGIVEGQNVEEASVVYSSDQRYQEYLVYRVAMDTLGDVAAGGNLVDTETDPVVLRHRLLAIVSEANGGGQDVSKKRAIWERNRRAGRGSLLAVTIDSWRDASGKLWTPNTLVPLDLPTLKIGNARWTLGEVTYQRDERGTHARLTLMPPTAYEPEPILLQRTLADVPHG